MAKKIKFALEMDNKIFVRTLEELREHFNFKKVVEHLVSGKLHTWLDDRYYSDEAETIAKLTIDSPDFIQKLYEILGIENKAAAIDSEYHARFIAVQQYVAANEIPNLMEQVACSQEELLNLLNDYCTKHEPLKIKNL